MNGLFITFEGPDGSGKTTQLKLLANYLKEMEYDVITTREPGGTVIGDKIREILLNPEYNNLKDQTEILMYAASRAQLVHEYILPNLKQGKIVLCDRYIDASIAYQSYGLQVERGVVEQINHFASSGLQPIRTYMLDLKPKSAQERLIKRSVEGGKTLDRIEQKDLHYHESVYKGFKTIANENPERVLLVNANQNIESIFSIIKNDMNLILNKF